jgi:hypothetical protein
MEGPVLNGMTAIFRFAVFFVLFTAMILAGNHLNLNPWIAGSIMGTVAFAVPLLPGMGNNRRK